MSAFRSSFLRPRRTMAALTANPDRLAIGLWIVGLYSALYAITVLAFAIAGRLPAVEP